MRDASGRESDTSSGTSVTRPRRRIPVVLLVLSALLAVGLVAERQDTPLATESAANRTQSFFTTKATKANVFSPSSPRSGRLPRYTPAPTPPKTDSAATVLGQANAAASKGLAQASAVRPNFHQTTSQICAILLSIAALVVSIIQRLINAYPFLAAQLRAILYRFLAAINAFLIRFGCPGLSLG